MTSGNIRKDLRAAVLINRYSRAFSLLYPAALLAVFLMALAPQGFMPTRTVNGFSIELCSGHTNSKLAVTPDHPDYTLLAMVYGAPEQQDIPEPESENPVCPFAATSGISLLTAGSTIALINPTAAQHEPEAQRHFAVRNRINIPPATGPPVTV